jgi:plastocyanin domain-containing protein
MFAIGTVPLMLTFGAISGLLSKGYTKKILKFSGVLIIVLGIIMGNRGLALAGVNINPLAYLKSNAPDVPSSGNTTTDSTSDNKALLKDGVQTLKITASNRGYTPAVTYVQKGVPLKLIIDGKQLNSCNNAIVIPSLNKQVKLKSGETVVEFTPGDKDIRYSCWMGMIRGTIKVVDDLGTTPASGADSEDSAYEDPYEEENIPTKPSIYGDDIAKVPTDRLVKKVQVSNNNQSIQVKGIGYELDPLIIVANKGMKTKLSLDLMEFDYIEGNYAILNTETGESVVDFLGKEGIIEVEFTLEAVGVYAILQDGNLLGVIDAVDDIRSADIEEVRKKYIR